MERNQLRNLILIVTSEYTDIQIKPEADSWSSYLTIWSPANSRLSDLRRTARARLVQTAEQFVLRLNTLAEDADLPANTDSVLTGDADQQPIVMTGHQPVVFHSGLAFKYESAEQFAADNNSICVAVIIDSDQGDAGQFSYPQESPVQNDEAEGNASVHPVLAIDTLAESHNLFAQGRLRPPADLKDLSRSVSLHLQQLSQRPAAESFERAVEYFSRLAAAKATAMEANTIMRWQYGIGSRMLELPLSAMAAFPECLALMADILKQPMRFAAAFNSALRIFRDENGIRNAANPFPDLKIRDKSCELPFWMINHNRGTRHVLEVHLDGNVTRLVASGKTVDTFTGNISDDTLEPMLLQNLQIVPRGALITAFLRFLFSDMFVHGTGGARYDRFTDEFIRSWWNAEPPPFTVATASRHLFSETRQELQRLRKIQSDLRDLRYNPQRYFGKNIFSESLETRLRDLFREKQAAVDCMKSFHADGQSAREAGQAIQKLTNEIRSAVNEEFEPQLQSLNSITPEQLDAINCRTYPWFFFAGD